MSAVTLAGCSRPKEQFEVVDEAPDYQIRRYAAGDGKDCYSINIRRTVYLKMALPGVARLKLQPTLEDARKELERFMREAQAAAAQPKSRRTTSSAGRSHKAARTSLLASPASAARAAQPHAAPSKVLQPVCLTAAAAVDPLPAHSLTGSMLTMRHIHNPFAPGGGLAECSRIQLGKLLAQGGFASVYQGKVLQLGDTPAATAAAAATARADVAVKVYSAHVPGCRAEQLQGYANNEHMALSLLSRQDNVVRLLATAVLDPADAAGRNDGAASANSQDSQHSCHRGTSSNGCYGGSSSRSPGGHLQTCLVLEYLPMGPTSNNEDRCPERLAKVVLRPVLRLLRVMHSGELGCRIIHRDIKPDNLLQRVPKSGRGRELVLADFGCCFIEVKPQDGPIVAGMRTSIGTSYFQAPELASTVRLAAPTGGMGASIDCYSFGVTITEMLGCLEVQEGMTMQEFQQQLVAFVDAPGDDTASAAVREFVGCCCGVGQLRAVAAAHGELARMGPEQLLETAWMRPGT